MTAPGAFDEALKSEPPLLVHGGKQDFLEPAVKGTTEVLEGIQRVAANSVKRVIFTSSFAAVGAFGREDETRRVYTEQDWNPVELDQIAEDDKRLAYLASKKFAEQAAWDFQKKGVNWDLVSLNPPMVYGPLVHRVSNSADFNENMYALTRTQGLARAHLLAMDVAEAGDNRFIICAGTVTSQQIADIFRLNVLGAEVKTPKGMPGAKTLDADAYTADTAKAEKVEKVWGLKWTDMRDTFKDLGKQLLEIEAAEGQ
ncbi:hypothetical protein BDV95DRAFT_623972 [Massariosphaeria phaeospora]|uniref:NAD-dependent epimerase/dehydratase domain-containing protein n=1 Tax=Massariosphaeria phaeospora TaxID=100035 RepID=A0A7C8M0Q0_9PLEO|nr:hypothetical protein BDV95DRAFT_623972 [Massariosphaeria phaeospora]